jgi:predicted DNA-binding transcriptional regulator YafY
MSDTTVSKRAIRLVELRRLLMAKARTAQELAERLGVPKRTINRDLEDLGIVGDGGQPPRYAMTETPSVLNVSEAIATHAALRLLYHHSPDRPLSYQEALEKIAKQLPASIRNIAHQSTDLHSRPKPNERALEIIARGWIERTVVQFNYVAPGGSGKARINEIEVYFIEVSRNNLEMYVIGLRRNWQPDIRTYRLGLIQNAVLLQQTYEIPASFDPKEYLSNAWGVMGDHGHHTTVKLKFEPSMTPWLQNRKFPGVQDTETMEDGAMIFTIRTGVNKDNLPLELIPWIRSWGANVEVLEPLALRQRWLAEAQAIVERFGGG